jgi:hypothetical protein
VRACRRAGPRPKQRSCDRRSYRAGLQIGGRLGSSFMRRPPIRRPRCPLAPEIWLCSWVEEGGARLSASLRPGDPLPRPTHHRCLWRGQMQSGERERAGSSKLRIENKQEIERFRGTKTPMRGSGACWWITAGRWSISRSEEAGEGSCEAGWRNDDESSMIRRTRRGLSAGESRSLSPVRLRFRTSSNPVVVAARGRTLASVPKRNSQPTRRERLRGGR